MNNDNDTPWVTASDVGKAEYCPYALYLAKKKVSVSKASKRNMVRGNQSHKKWDVERDSGVGGFKLLVLRVVVIVFVVALLVFILSGL